MPDDLPPPAPARAADVDTVVDLVLAAFWADPLWSWAIPPEVPDRADTMRRLWRLYVRGAVPHGWVTLDASRRATAVWIPSGAAELPADETGSLPEVLDRHVGACAPAVLELMDLFEHSHPSEPPHHYLSLWATDPAARGLGLGTALLRHDLARLDAQGSPTYLESSNPANDPLYERLGYLATGAVAVPGGPSATTFWREPTSG